MASINTANGMKNTHAKGEGWFNADKYPTIAFTSSAITKTASGFEAKGALENMADGFLPCHFLDDD